MTQCYKFTKQERLSGDKRISTLFEKGESGFVYPFRYVFSRCEVDAEVGGGVTVLISVPKRNHKKANKRNLIKRRAKEAYRTKKNRAVEIAKQNNLQIDIAMMYGSKDIVEYKKIENAIEKILAEITARL